MVTRAALILLCLGLAAGAQSKPKTPAQGTAPKAASKAAPAKAAPTAIIHTTAGDLKCTLFPAQAPKAVANFIGLAKGTKPWKDPATGNTVHKPLYDGTIFHRTIPEFMIQGGDPSGTGAAMLGLSLKTNCIPTCSLTSRDGLPWRIVGRIPTVRSSSLRRRKFPSSIRVWTPTDAWADAAHRTAAIPSLASAMNLVWSW